VLPPSFDDLLSLVAPPNANVEAWLLAHVPRGLDSATPLDVQDLLGLVYVTVDLDDDEDCEAAFEWLERARSSGLSRFLSADPAAALAWSMAAGRSAWAWWKPALERVPEHDVKSLERHVSVATNPTSSPEELLRARREMSQLPKRGPPPPYAGHFYGGVGALLEARRSSGQAHFVNLAESLFFFDVAPDGTSRIAEIAALLVAKV
jgi:hypothetical protein